MRALSLSAILSVGLCFSGSSSATKNGEDLASDLREAIEDSTKSVADVQLLLEQKAEPIAGMLSAVRTGHVGKLQCLLDARADVNQLFQSGGGPFRWNLLCEHTLLEIAVRNANLAVVRALMQAGAHSGYKMKRQGLSDETHLKAAVSQIVNFEKYPEESELAILDCLLEESTKLEDGRQQRSQAFASLCKKFQTFSRKLCEIQEEAFRSFCKYDTDLMSPVVLSRERGKEYSATPLIIIVKKASIPLLAYFLKTLEKTVGLEEIKHYVETTDSEGNCPLFVAAIRGSCAAMWLLSGYSASALTKHDEIYGTLAHALAQKIIYAFTPEEREKYIECAKFLREWPVNLSQKNYYGYTAAGLLRRQGLYELSGLFEYQLSNSHSYSCLSTTSI